MATVSKWTPFGVALDITATGGTVTRTSATSFTVKINASWETYYEGAQTNYGMTAASGGVTHTISAFNGTKRSSGSGSFTGTYSISGNGSATKSITVTFRNFNTDNGDSASKSVSFNVSVPAWTSYTITYNANGGSGAPGSQTKWKDQTLTLSSTKPTRTGYSFLGWSTSASATSAKYLAGGNYTANAAVTLYAVWELTYTKPTISSLTASRCDSTGTVSDSGTYARIGFTWSTSISVTSVVISWTDSAGTVTGNFTVATSGTGGTVSQIVGDGLFNVETSYSFTITVTDGNDSTDRNITMSGTEFHMDFSKNSVAIGKPAETLYGTDGAAFKAFDVKWRSKFRECVCLGDKTHYHDGNQGIFLSWEGFMHLQRTTAQGYHPYIGFYLDDSTSADGTIRVNANTKLMEFLNADGYHFGADILLNNNEAIMGYNSAGVAYNAFQAKNESDNTIVGYGNYANASGNTNIYGYDINFGVANIANPGTYRPYRRKGDSTTITIRTAGYVTNGGKDISFWIPFSEPIIGSPTATITSGSGFVLRQGTKYTHGSTSSTNVHPDSYEATATMIHGVYVKAVFSDTTNVTNNDSIGIYWNGTITFS